jgi:hypothetical protein
MNRSQPYASVRAGAPGLPAIGPRGELERARQAQRLLRSADILARAHEIVALETPERLIHELRAAAKGAR